MFYIAFGGEVNTEEMIREAKKTGKLICVPVCRKDKETMQPAILQDHVQLKKGPYGVLEFTAPTAGLATTAAAGGLDAMAGA